MSRSTRAASRLAHVPAPTTPPSIAQALSRPLLVPHLAPLPPLLLRDRHDKAHAVGALRGAALVALGAHQAGAPPTPPKARRHPAPALNRAACAAWPAEALIQYCNAPLLRQRLPGVSWMSSSVSAALGQPPLPQGAKVREVNPRHARVPIRSPRPEPTMLLPLVTGKLPLCMLWRLSLPQSSLSPTCTLSTKTRHDKSLPWWPMLMRTHPPPLPRCLLSFLACPSVTPAPRVTTVQHDDDDSSVSSASSVSAPSLAPRRAHSVSHSDSNSGCFLYFHRVHR